MPHQVLKCLWIDTGFRHIAAICMSANMWHYLRQFLFINLVVLLKDMLEYFSQWIATIGISFLSRKRNWLYPSITGSLRSFFLFSIMIRKHSHTSSEIGIVLLPASLFGVSIRYLISELLIS